MEKIDIIEYAVNNLINDQKDIAGKVIEEEYHFSPIKPFSRTYTIEQKINQFESDGFIDRYTGDKLVNPGILKILSTYFSEIFPYQAHWKMSECHIAYWELFPTIDHIYPICMGGEDAKENWVTTSMLHNSVKSNWTLEQLNWNIKPVGNLQKWDGLTGNLIKLVEKDEELLKDNYIKSYYKASKK